MKIALVLAALLAVPTMASATVTTTDYTFSATFASGPYTTLGGSFSIESDDVAGTNILSALDFSIGSAIFDTSNSTMYLAGPDIAIGADIGDPNAVYANTDDFFLSFHASTLTQGILAYATADFYGSFSFDVTVAQDGPGLYVPQASGVPEPASWALMLVGFGAIGAGLRGRRQRQVCAPAA